MRMSAQETLVIVGNGMASHALCQALGHASAADRPKIIVCGDEPHAAYNRVRLSELMGGVDPEVLTLAPASWYAERGIELRTGERVSDVDLATRTLTTDAGATLHYDRLVLATGSYAFRPPIPGIDDPRCFVYRARADVEALEAALPDAKRAVVIGGGLLGLEAAKVLLDRGLQVRVIEAAHGLLLRQIDLESAECLKREVEALGVEVRVGTQAAAVEREGGALQLRLAGGEVLPTDLVVMAAGVRPRDELARAAGLQCSLRGGVVVDDGMCTSDPNVYAVGECVSHHGQTYGLVGPCRDMARVLAKRLLGGRAAFAEPDLSCRLKLMGISVVAVGDYVNEHTMTACDTGTGRRTLLRDGRRLVGAIAVGPWPELAQIERAIARRQRFSGRALDRFITEGTLFGGRGALPVAMWPDDAIVCNCAHVSVGELRRQCAAASCDIETLARTTGATAGCGSCTPLVGELLGESGASSAPARTFGLLGWSLAACLTALLFYAMAPLEFSASVADAWRAVDRFWRDGEIKQITGFVTVGMVALAFILSARKRISAFKLGALNLYRVLHAAIGLATMLALVAHTGFRLGNNLNFALMTSFLALNLLGAVVGFASSTEADVSRPISQPARRLRPYATLLHILLVWPLPVLLGLHVLSVYYF